ncbi:MAG: hypothetical protein SO127_05895, partial [Muribaculaceae bacterium]|nr:hypothetical protein [Muribaculaceae bacterium]
MRPESSLTLTRFRLTPYAQRSVRPTSAEAETMTMKRGGHFRHPGGGGRLSATYSSTAPPPRAANAAHSRA